MIKVSTYLLVSQLLSRPNLTLGEKGVWRAHSHETRQELGEWHDSERKDHGRRIAADDCAFIMIIQYDINIIIV